jgi:predicted ATPase with chaperone activity
VHRPVVLTGGELMMEQLDLQYDENAKMYQAPFQVKANGGVLIIDDFGRQRMEPRELLNRWIVPLEKRVDFLTLHTGGKFPVPFDCLLIFATNIRAD